LSTRSNIATSHNMQLSILSKNLCCVVQRLAAFALASAFVSNHSSWTSLILMPSGKVVAAEEYSLSSLFCDVAGLALSTSMWIAFTHLMLFTSCLITPSSIAQYCKVTWTPVVSPICALSASLSNLSAEKRSHPSPVVSLACCS